MASHQLQTILIINPNTTQSMTDGLKPLVESLNISDTTFKYMTAPSGVPSINNEHDGAVSAEHCLPAVRSRFQDHEGFLVCCFSAHPLVGMLQNELARLYNIAPERTPVTGIFEAAMAACLKSDGKFGIVSTGSQWKKSLHDAVYALIGAEKADARFAGTETTGLNASELHSTDPADVRQRMKDATKRLVKKDVKSICLGCAGMAGMDEAVREACVEELGEVEGQKVKIVDGVISGVKYLRGEL